MPSIVLALSARLSCFAHRAFGVASAPGALFQLAGLEVFLCLPFAISLAFLNCSGSGIVPDDLPEICALSRADSFAWVRPVRKSASKS